MRLGWALIITLATTIAAGPAAGSVELDQWSTTSLPEDASATTAQAATWPEPVHRAQPAAAAGGLVLVAALGPLYHRLDRSGVLEHPKRRRILEMLAEEPHLSINRIADELDVHYRTAQHHVDTLERFGFVTLHRRSGQFHILPRGAEAPPPEPASRRVLAAVVDEPGRHVASVARAVDRAQSTVRWHLDRLERRGLVRVERDGGLTRLWPTTKGRRRLDQRSPG